MTCHCASESRALRLSQAAPSSVNDSFRSVRRALRARSPVVVDVPVPVRQLLLRRYVEVSIRNGRLGVISLGLLLFGLAHEVPLMARLVAGAVLSVVLVLRVALAERMVRGLDSPNPPSTLAHDLLLLAASTSWSFAPFVLQGHVSPPNLAGVLYGALAVIAVLSVSYHSALPATVVLITASVVPLVTFMALQRTLTSGVLAVTTAICVGALLTRVLAGHRTLLRALAAEQANAQLVRKLQGDGRRLEHENAQLGHSLRDARLAASRDPLTGLYNRRHLEAFAAPLADTVRRRVEEVALCVVDIDHFKRINDAHGHAVGDEVLQAVADLLGSRLREADCLARLGGEEFVAVLRRCDIGRGQRVAEALRLIVGGVEIETHAGPVGATVSIGVAQWAVDETFESALRRADRALYQAKRAGRDRVEVDTADAMRLSVAAIERTRPGALH
jgi:diguanylate cyclase (GGDEF)-like protein